MDPRSVRADRQRFRRDMLPALERANSLYCPLGRWPSRGWVLLPRSEYDQLDKYSTTLQLNIGDPSSADNVKTLKNLAIVQARCVTRGIASDPNALYLIELTDGRGILNNEWFRFPSYIQAGYNVRSPAYPQAYYQSTQTWTWTTMLQDMWVRMSAFLGAWPGLPSVPTGTPEGYWFPGVPAWTALCDVLQHVGMVVACDLTKAAPFTIVGTGADDVAFTALQAKYATNLEDDQEWIDVGAGRAPKTVVVLFRRRNSIYGSEETVRRDSPYQWLSAPYYAVPITAPATFASAVGTHHIWSDFTVRYDMDGVPLGADTATAAAIAAERVVQYFDDIYSRTSGYMSQTYAGALPFATGSQIDGVCWRWGHGDTWHGWQTEVVRGPQPPWSGIWGD